MSAAYLTTAHLYLDASPRVSDRTADLGLVAVRLSADVAVHVSDAGQAREIADAFTIAARMLDEAGSRVYTATRPVYTRPEVTS